MIKRTTNDHMDNLADLRKEYTQATLDVKSVSPDPLQQFSKWFDEALNSKALEPSAMTLATISETGRPSARVVLLKGVSQGRFYFYTNYQSNKGRDLDHNPACAMTFFWPELERQVRISGVAERATAAESDQYFQSRPVGSQIGAWASPQSAVIKDRDILEARVKELEKKYEGQQALPRPKQWGGFAVAPYEIEFWQGRRSRLHDRILYTWIDGKWAINRLAP